MSSLRTRTLGFLFLLSSIVAGPSCNPVPVLLLNLSQLPMDSSRIYVIVKQGNDTGKATFQREAMTNKWLPMESATLPPEPNCPPTVQLAVELPRGTSGAVALSIQVDPPQPMPMMGMMPTTINPPVGGACLHPTLQDGALNTIDIPLLPMGPPPCN